jgi:hypothetical protein
VHRHGPRASASQDAGSPRSVSPSGTYIKIGCFYNDEVSGWFDVEQASKLRGRSRAASIYEP